MKKLLFITAIAMIVIQSCGKSDSTSGNELVSEKAKHALKAKYPGANNVLWQNKNGYVIATFFEVSTRAASSQQLDAWFDNTGSWYMTETNINFDQLPDAVKTTHRAGIYSDWQVDDVDKIERNGTEIIYVIEVELNDKEMDLYYSSDGLFIKEMADMNDDYDYEDFIPAVPNTSIENYLKTNYPTARILEIDLEDRFTEVEILDGIVKRELIFDGNSWLHTKTELSIAEIPAAIMDVLKTSAYDSYRIDDVDYYITATTKYYYLELKSALGDVNIKITDTGVLTVVETDLPGDGNYTGSTNHIATDFIAKQYSGARIIESEYENGYLEVKIYHANLKKTVRFNASYTWVDTHWDVRASDLPEAVKNTIAASAYAAYHIDDTECFQTLTGDYYKIELEDGDQEVILRIKTNGSML